MVNINYNTIKILRIEIWSGNGITQLAEELKSFINSQNIDVMLISDKQFTRSKLHSDGTVHVGTAIIIKSTIKYHELPKFNKQLA